MKRYLVIIFVLLLGSLMAGQYSLEELIESGLDNASNIIKSNYDLKDSESSLYSSFLRFLPDAGLSYNQSQTKDYGWSPRSTSFRMNFGLSLNEGRVFNIIQSNLNYKQSRLNRKEVKRTFAYSVLDKYTRVLETQTNLEISRQNLALQQKILEQTGIMYDNGQKSLLDYKQSQLNLIDYEIQVKTNENNLTNQRADLFSYLNLNDNGNELKSIDLEASTDISFKTSTNSIITYKNNLEKTDVNRKQQLIGFLPDLSVNWNYGRTNSWTPQDSISVFKLDGFDESYSFGLSVSLDFLDYPDKFLNYGIQKRMMKRAKLDLSDAKRNLKNSYNNQLNSLNTLQTTFELYEQKKQLSQENLEMAQEQYSLGIIGLLDLDRFKIDYQNAQVSYNGAYYELIRARENLNLLLSNKIMGRW